MSDKQEILDKVRDYNQKIAALIAERTAFMDANMHLFSKFQIGDDIYRDGRKLGVVTQHYRYWAGQNKLLDKSMSVNCRYEMDGMSNCFGNTSSDGGEFFFDAGPKRSNP